MKKYLTLFILSSSVSLLALPSGGHVVKGDATLSLTSDAVQIKANGKAIIQWDQFDIASREAVSFAQSQTKEAVLNRVVSGSASQIYGLLQANCPIYLINPQGVFIGSAAQISTAGFLASTADISNEAFWQGSELRFENLGPGNIVNLGTITSGQGDVVFIARSIDNQGKIPAPNGVVTFTTSEVMINPETKQTVFIRVGEVEEGISNSGTIQALAIDFKTQSPYEKAIHHTGTLEALTLQEQNGRIYLVADRGGSVVDGSVIAKSGEVRLLGQEVSLQEHANVNVSGAAGGTVLIGGDYRGANPEILNAKRTSIAGGATLLADGSIGNAGRIIIWGDEVTSYQGAISCQALGKSGDGGFVEISAKSNHLKFEGVVNTLAVNGKTGELLLDPVNITVNDFGGTSTPAFPTTPPGTYAPTTVTSANLDVANVQTALATTNVIIDATTGTGGPTAGNITFVLGPTWSANTTLTAIAARTLTVSGTISATGEGSVNFTGNGQGGTAVGEGIYVQPAGVIQTNSGNITLNGTGITVSHSPSPLEQCDGILIDGQVLTNSGFINMTGQTGALAFGDEGVCIRGLVNSLVSGDILMTGSVSPSSASSNGVIIRNGGIVLSTGSGNIVLDGTSIGTGGELNTGVELAGDSATATCQALGTGNITVNGVVLSGPAAIGQGVQIATRSTLSANSGTINITGTNYATGSNNTGVTVSNTGVISSNSGDINITGQTSASSDSSQALIVTATSVIQSNSGNIVVNAVNSSPLGNAQPGIQVSGSTSTIQNVNGNIQLTGQAGGVTTSNNGIQLDSAGSVKTTGAGTITMTGTGGAGTSVTNGILVTGTGSEISSSDGAINLAGTGGGASTSGSGISVLAGGQIINTGTGSITLNGTASPLGTGSNGIFVSGTTSAIKAASGSITAIATGSGTGTSNIGLNVSSAGSISTISGPITVSSATGSTSGTTGGYGIFIDGNNSKITSASGPISLTGTGGGSGSTNQGIHLSNAGSIKTTATAPITLTGAGSMAGTSSDEGIFLTNTLTKISTVDGPIQLIGTAGGGTTNGITVDSSATVVTGTTGKITVNSSNNLAVQNNSILQTLGAGGPNLNDIAVTTNGVSVTAGALGPALISTVNGNIGINSSGANVNITGGSSEALIQSTTKGSITVNALNLIVQGGSAVGQTGITTPSGDINVSCLQNCQYSAPTAGALAVMQTFGSNLTVVVGGSINLTGFSTVSTPAPTGNLLMIAGQNISIGSTSQVMASGTVNSSLTLVVDNDFPTAPGIGPGQFILATGGIVSAGAGTPVRIYTARRSQNTITAPINGAPFVAGPFDVNSSTEQWTTYYPSGTYGGAVFKIYYKEPGPIPSAAYTDIAANLVELADLLPLLKALRLPRYRFPSYHFQICEGRLERMYCAPTFSPYGSFIFEDNLYWIGVEF